MIGKISLIAIGLVVGLSLSAALPANAQGSGRVGPSSPRSLCSSNVSPLENRSATSQTEERIDDLESATRLLDLEDLRRLHLGVESLLPRWECSKLGGPRRIYGTQLRTNSRTRSQ